MENKNKSINRQISKEAEIISFLKNNDWQTDSPKICCLYQKNTLSDQIIGISYINLNSSIQNQKYLKENINSILFINFGEYPSYDLNSFLDYLTELNPELILIHGHSESHLISNLNKRKIFQNKIKEISFINYKLKNAQIIIQDYLENYSNLPHIQSMTTTSDILSFYDYNAQCAMFSLFSLIKKMLAGINDPPCIKFQNIFFNDLLYCSPKTRNELCIFQQQLHPSLIKGFGKGKEGLSIFNLFNKCSTNQGKKLLKNIILFPLKDIKKLNQRYQCIQDFANINNYTVIKSLLANLSSIKDLENTMEDLKSFVINPKVWIILNNSLSGILRIIEIMKTLKSKISIISELLDEINLDDIQKIYDFLSVCFEFGRVDEVPIIKEGVSDTLDEINNKYKGIDKILQMKANEYRNQLPINIFFDEFQICFYPQIGYLVGIIKNNKYKYLMKKYGQKFLNKIETEEFFEFPYEDINIEKSEKLNENEIISEDEKNIYKGERKVSNIIEINSENNNIRKQNKIMTQINEEGEQQENEEEEDKIDEIKETKEIKEMRADNDNLKNNETIKEEIKELDEENEENENDEKILTNYEETLILRKLKITDNNELKFLFHNEKLIYYKNNITEELDNKYGDLQSKLLDCENNVFRQISKQILGFESELIKVNKFISFLDVFIHLYIFSDKYKLYKPIISNECNNMEFKEGRNAITEIIIGANYIPSSFNSNNKNINIISGPISSGKSIFLNLIGTLSYMAQVGSYIPAVNYKSCPFKMILSNISISENNIDQLSGFTTEAKEIKKIIDIFEAELLSNENINENEKKEENNLLILLDTPFKRTSEKNQNCLIGGTLKYLYSVISKNPNNKSKIFITLKPEVLNFLQENNLIIENYTNIFEMETLKINNIKNNNSNNIAGIVQTYKLKEKFEKEKKSKQNNEINQLLLAKELGLDNSLFLRALEIENLFKKKQKIFPNLEYFIKNANSLNNNKKELYDKIMNYTKSQISLENNEQELKIIKYLNDIFN